MAITNKTHKILWARSGNRCAICRCELVNESTICDGNAIIGEECHIVAHELNGPRGNSSLSNNERDKPANLILLCRNHHKEIDDQPNTFTVEYLKKIKAEHEAWVRKNLTTHKQADPQIFFAFRVDSGTQFCNTVLCFDAFHFNNDQPETKEEAELIGNFAQSIEDYADLWSDIEAKQRVLAQFEFDEQIHILYDQGFLVYAMEQRKPLKSFNIEKPIEFSIAYVFVLRKSNSLVKRKDNKIEQIMYTNGQHESDFTNFIPVIPNSSSFKLI
jgi:hypothetical protein